MVAKKLVNRLKKQARFYFKRSAQRTNSHCGPAVVKMLLHHLGIEKTQDQITQAAGVVSTIKRYGTRVDQLAKAVRRIAPGTRLWYKRQASISDIRRLLKSYQLPVAVEWQGVFEDGEGEEKEDGHYSIVVGMDSKKRLIKMVDPYRDYAKRNRQISYYRFLRRWWDDNVYKNPQTGQRRSFKDQRLLFVITPKILIFPKELGLKRA